MMVTRHFFGGQPLTYTITYIASEHIPFCGGHYEQFPYAYSASIPNPKISASGQSQFLHPLKLVSDTFVDGIGQYIIQVTNPMSSGIVLSSAPIYSNEDLTADWLAQNSIYTGGIWAGILIQQSNVSYVAPLIVPTYASIEGAIEFISDNTFVLPLYASNMPSEINLGAKIKIIGYDSFEDYSNLQQIGLPSTLEYIGEGAFSSCTSLTKIIYDGTLEKWNSIEKAVNWYDSGSNIQLECTNGTMILS